jgi:hypothetical protein
MSVDATNQQFGETSRLQLIPLELLDFHKSDYSMRLVALVENSAKRHAVSLLIVLIGSYLMCQLLEKNATCCNIYTSWFHVEIPPYLALSSKLIDVLWQRY